MLELKRRSEGDGPVFGTLTLPFDRRQKSRLRAQLDSDDEGGPVVAIELPRGACLRDGDRLQAETGEVVVVRAAPEAVSVVVSSDVLTLARAAYHLGNRHVPLQIAEGELRYQYDHVLDDMVRGLGVPVTHATLPFEPEPGAYGAGHSLLSHGHRRTHSHSHDPKDGPEHEH